MVRRLDISAHIPVVGDRELLAHYRGFKRTSVQGSLAGGEKVELISSLLLKGLFFQMLNIFGM